VVELAAWCVLRDGETRLVWGQDRRYQILLVALTGAKAPNVIEKASGLLQDREITGLNGRVCEAYSEAASDRGL
jgi:hypothetical protein